MTTTEDAAKRFVPSLLALVRDPERPDRARLAALRRGLGKPPGEADEMYPLVEPHLPDDAWPTQIDAAYTVAGLFGYHHQHWPLPADGQRERHSLGASLGQIRLREGGDEDQGVARRFLALLDARPEELPRRLFALFSLMKSGGREVAVDYYRLYHDLANWGDADRGVQRRWAADFWRATAPAPGTDPPPPGDGQTASTDSDD